MFKYICKRITQMILVLVIVSIATFTLIKVAPGDVLNAYISPTLTAEEVEQIKEDLGLDKSNVEQYLSWLNNVLHGNWGYSHVNHQSVKNQIEEKLPATIGLMGTALIFSLLVAIPLGLISGVKRNGIIDNIVSFFSYISISIPGFWFGILLIMLFALKLKWLPASGMHSIGEKGFLDLVKHAILPILVVSVGQIGVYARYVRANTVSQMEEEYVLTAVSKGTSPMKILFRHVLKNCMLPIITLVGMSLVNLVTGSFIIESVFGWPGIGTFSITSLNNRDYPVVMAITMLSCTVLVVGIFLSDILYTLIDPRIKTKGQASYE